MKRFVPIALLIGGIAVSQPSAVLKTEVKSFYKSELGSIRLAGICSADDGGACWNAAGNRDPKLTTRFRRAWAASALPFRYKKKNRIALFEIEAKPPNKSGDRLYPLWHFWPVQFEWPGMSDKGRHIEPYEISCDLDQSVVDVGFGASRNAKPSETLPTKPGAGIQYQGTRWVFSGAYTGDHRGYSQSQATIVLTTSRTVPNLGQYQWELIDRRGRTIKACDFRGRAVAGIAPRDPEWTAWQNFNSSPTERAVFTMRETALIPEEVVLTTNVRISDIAGLRIQSSQYEQITFKDIPLEPRR